MDGSPPGHHGYMIAAAFPYILMAGYTVISLFALASGEAYLVARRTKAAVFWRAAWASGPSWCGPDASSCCAR